MRQWLGHHLPRLLVTDVDLGDVDDVVVAQVVVVASAASALTAVAVASHHVARQEELLVPGEALAGAGVGEQVLRHAGVVRVVEVNAAVRVGGGGVHCWAEGGGWGREGRRRGCRWGFGFQFAGVRGWGVEGGG